MNKEKSQHLHFVIPKGLMEALDKQVEEESKHTVERLSRAIIARKALVKYLNYVNNETR